MSSSEDHDEIQREHRAARLQSAAAESADVGEEERAPRELATAETLRRNAGDMKETSAEIRRTREQLELRSHAVNEIAEATRRMAARTASLRKGMRRRRGDQEPESRPD